MKGGKTNISSTSYQCLCEHEIEPSGSCLCVLTEKWHQSTQQRIQPLHHWCHIIFVIVVLFLEIISRRLSTRLLSSSCLEEVRSHCRMWWWHPSASSRAPHMAPACPPWSSQGLIKPSNLCWFHKKLRIQERSASPFVQRADVFEYFRWMSCNKISEMHLCCRVESFNWRKPGGDSSLNNMANLYSKPKWRIIKKSKEEKTNSVGPESSKQQRSKSLKKSIFFSF